MGLSAPLGRKDDVMKSHWPFGLVLVCLYSAALVGCDAPVDTKNKKTATSPSDSLKSDKAKDAKKSATGDSKASESTSTGDKDAKVITTKSGLKYQDLTEGSGPAAKAGDTVAVHYTGWLKSGRKFDSSKDRDQPLEFKIGVSDVIQGWHEGVVGMKVGGKRKLNIPPELAYGKRGYPGAIPPDAELTFEIDLLQIK
jgi:FKBP-type peptidyl-prolyl cis-trans isomerase